MGTHSVGDHEDVSALPPSIRMRGADRRVAILIVRATHARVGRGRVDDNVVPVHSLTLFSSAGSATRRSVGVDSPRSAIVPFGAPDFHTAPRWGAETYHALLDLLKKKNYPTAVGDEGGFAPKVASNEEPLELITLAIEQAGYGPVPISGSHWTRRRAGSVMRGSTN